MKKQRILAVHLLNDLSGSPLVFRESLLALGQEGYDIHLFTATPSGNGFLTGLPDIEIHPLSYRWSRNKMLTLCFFLSSQFSLFGRLLLAAKRDDIVYVNSILPFGAALAGWLKGCRVIYHIHEVSIRPALLKKWLLWVIARTATECIYVSNFVRQHPPLSVPAIVIYNALPADFTKKSSAISDPGNEKPFTVLMLCSLKKYKGVDTFIACARALPLIQFNLVLNAVRADILRYFTGVPLPPNCKLFDAQSDTHPFYRSASVVMNLSLPDQWVETFGMTILEGMCYGIPVIVPPVGGVSELVEDEVDGFYADSRNPATVIEKIELLSRDKNLRGQMGRNAYEKASHFRQEQFAKAITTTFYHLLKKRNHEEEENRYRRYGRHTG